MTLRRRLIAPLAAAAAAALLLSGCIAGEDGDQSTVTVDFATYNPLSLIIKQNGWLDDALADRGVTVEWVQSAGSNKANELLRSESADVASTAGSAALLARANGSPIHTIDIYSQPEWSAFVVGPDSTYTSVADLKGKKIAATKGTDPYFFLLQALDQAGLTPDDVEIVNLQHADGWTALKNGSVEAWSGLDPIMATAEEDEGAQLIYRNVDFNTYGFLNATESFLDESPEMAQTVVDVYEYARDWAEQHPDETIKALSDAAGITVPVATTVIEERSNLDVSGVPGQAQLDVLKKVGPVFVDTGDVADQSDIDDALDTLLDPSFAEQADPEAIADIVE